MNLELMAMRWLRWEKRCVVVIMERSPRAGSCGQPDVLGMTKDRYLTEIEIKRSLSDFRADMKKFSRRNRDLHPDRFPKRFYYLVPNELAFKVMPELPEWAGLMRGPGSEDSQRVFVLKPSPVLESSKRLTIKECAYLSMKMANQILSLAECNEGIRNRAIRDDGNETWMLDYHPDYSNFQI